MAEALNTGIMKQNSNHGSGQDLDQGARGGIGPEEQAVGEGLGPWSQRDSAELRPNPTGCKSNVSSPRQPACKPIIWGIS